MTTEQQKELWLKFHRFQIRYEMLYHPKINKELKEQVKTYVKYRDTVYIRSGGLYTVLLDLYKTVGSAWAYQTRSVQRVQKGGGQMGFSDRIVSFMQRYFGFDLLNDAEGITQTTIRLIQEVLSEAAIEGWSFDEIVSKLEAPDFTAIRARLIARTETVGAANAASLVNAKDSGATSKIWISARDSRVRMHHAEVNQTIIPIDAKFNVGGYQMSYPGDKAGGASEVCNCRCVIAGVVEEKNLSVDDFIDHQQKEIAPLFETVNKSMGELETMVLDSVDENKRNIIQSNSEVVSIFTEKLKQAIADLPTPVVNVEAPVVNIPEPVVNVEAPIVHVTEQKVDQGQVISLINNGIINIMQVGKEVISGQKDIIKLLGESLKPKPKKEWEFTTVIENGRIKKVIAKEK